MNTVETMREALFEAGFETAEITCEQPPLAFPTLADFWEWRVSFPAPHRVFSALPASERARLKVDSLEALRPLAGDGEVRADQAALFVLAR